jgi:hypothetical protein
MSVRMGLDVPCDTVAETRPRQNSRNALTRSRKAALRRRVLHRLGMVTNHIHRGAIAFVASFENISAVLAVFLGVSGLLPTMVGTVPAGPWEGTLIFLPFGAVPLVDKVLRTLNRSQSAISTSESVESPGRRQRDLIRSDARTSSAP